MKGKTFSFSLFLCFCVASQFYEKPIVQEDSIQLKVAAYNVEYSTKGSATEIGEMLSPYNFDIVCFSEAPGGDWTKEVAKAMGMDHVVVGHYSTAGHKDKYKTIASRTPLYDYEEILMADTLHTVTKAVTLIADQEIAIYSVHFPFGWRDQAHIDETTSKVTAFVDYLEDKQSDDAIPVVMGDFNFTLSNSSYTSPYYEMFVEIGLDASWPDLGIDVSRLGTMVKYEPEENSGGGVIDLSCMTHLIRKLWTVTLLRWKNHCQTINLSGHYCRSTRTRNCSVPIFLRTIRSLIVFKHYI